MKSKLYLFGLVSISLLMFSCSNDDLENIEIQNINFDAKSEVSTQKPDSIITKSKIAPDESKSVYSGDPSNPKPPRP